MDFFPKNFIHVIAPHLITTYRGVCKRVYGGTTREGGVRLFYGGRGLFVIFNIFINMNKKKIKEKLKRRGSELYSRYFYNPPEIINEIIEQYDNGCNIDDNKCEVIFDTKETPLEQIYELIMYFPNLLKKIKYITDDIVIEMYAEYGETIRLLNNNKPYNGKTIRNRLYNNAYKRAIAQNIEFDLISEDIKLVTMCPFLGVQLEYLNSESADYSPSLDRIDPNLGYTKNNIQVVSFLANRMKNSASIEQLLTFSKNILKLYP